MPDQASQYIEYVDARLRSFVERLEHVIEETKTLATDKKEILAEAKGVGFDTKIIKQIIKERSSDIDDLREESSLMETYRRALNMPDPHGTRETEEEAEPEAPPQGVVQRAA